MQPGRLFSLEGFAAWKTSQPEKAFQLVSLNRLLSLKTFQSDKYAINFGGYFNLKDVSISEKTAQSNKTVDRVKTNMCNLVTRCKVRDQVRKLNKVTLVTISTMKQLHTAIFGSQRCSCFMKIKVRTRSFPLRFHLERDNV